MTHQSSSQEASLPLQGAPDKATEERFLMSILKLATNVKGNDEPGQRAVSLGGRPDLQPSLKAVVRLQSTFLKL